MQAKINVLLAAPNSGMVGGIMRWTKNVYAHWYQHKSESNIKLAILDIARKRGGYYGQAKFQRLIWALQDYGKIFCSTIKALNKSDADIFHLTSPGNFRLWFDYWLIKWCKYRKIKSIVHFHFGRIPQIFKSKGWEYNILCKVVKTADYVVVIDKKSYNTLIAAGFSNIELLPNPLTPKVASIISENKNIEKSCNEIVFAGHVIKTKGVFELVEASKDIPNIKLRIIGAVSNEMRQQLIAAAGRGCESWLFIEGEKSQEETIKAMMSAALFVLPTYTEGFPNVIIESMACGCPIVTTAVGAIPEMLDIENGNNCGICVEPQDVEQLRAAMIEMINDRNYAINCGKNAQKRVCQLYSMDSVCSQMENIWKTTINLKTR